MDNKKLERWAQQLLDTGKKNNLINFKDTKASTAEVVFPDGESFYEKCLSASSFEIYDPKIADTEDDEEAVASANTSEDETQEIVAADKLKKSDYVELYSSRIRKNNQVLVYAKTPNPMIAVRNIDKKARDFLEETGVNVAYLAFGFVRWKENEHSEIVNKAPLLLVPINHKNESSVTPYYIELTEDDVVVNPTFNYLLEAQYGIKLPEYEEDELLSSYITKVQSIVSKLHWEVTSECKMGIFSFLKINMYHDLMNNADKILKNDNVRLLLGEPVDFKDSMADGDVGRVENEIIDLHTVVDADSSQIEAIEMAKTGKSFVLQGPPGTGKSQTITNIISECLHDGKKVLFVSEKLAALSVVYDKLKQAGLEEFCLELHSYKSSKKEVIAELCKTLRADRSAVSSRADREVQAKAKLQEQLDAYAEELHKPIPVINKSMYQLYDAHSAHRNAPDLELVLNDIAKKDEAYLNEAVNLLGQYEEYVPTIGEDYRKNEWYGYKSQNSSYEAQNKLKQDIQVIITGLKDLISKADTCEEEYSVKMDTIFGVERYIQLLNVLSSTQFLRPGALLAERINELIGTTKFMAELSSQILPIRQRLDESFEENIYKIDGQDYYNKLTKLYSGFFSRLFNAEYKSIVSDLRLASRAGKKPSYAVAQECMKALMDYQSLMGQFDGEKSKIDGLLDLEVVSPDTNWNQLNSELEIIRICFENDYSCGSIANMSDETFAAAKAGFSNHANTLAGALGTFKHVLTELQNDFDTDYVSFDAMSLSTLLSKVQQCMDSIDKVENWVRFYILLKQLEERDLKAFIDCAVDNHVDKNQIAASYQRLFYKQWINHVIFEKPVFANFTRIAQDRAVEQFSEKDRLQFEISKAQIKAELSAKRPSLDMMAGGSAVSILLREGEKKRKQKSIRKLLAETADVVQVIKPCFLMSPLSVSTFLSENSISFDTVVFDEASQIFPQDAIGAIYRAKQLIVVGDSKQMPPSNFFNSSVEIDDDDEETGDVTDFESILDLCSTSLPQLRLKWHYRSRYEQLITFSNKNFYDNTLVTFPSSTIDHEGIGVDYYHVDGLFDRKSHTNRKEAEFIVDLIYRNIDQHPKRSLGVVAFSVAQQDLIERLLSKRRQEDSSKEWFFKRDDATKEPFFVKNLETVQGDERDTIIFSVAYGMDSQGRLLHNFGPLNRAGGERRLNVAVTRAKDNVQLVSSMHATDIDLSRTSAEGARLLREYLDYAENGDVALERSISVNPFEQFDSEFEMDVCDFLRNHGFTVDMQVGCSGFRIDIGLKKPNSSDYVLAIECDGATYHSSKNARDRDRLRQEILERMGWRFYRIWSTDWFRNTAVEKERLLKAATEAIHLGRYVKAEEAKKEEEAPVVFEKTIAPKHLAFPEYVEADVYSLRNSHLYGNQLYVKNILEIEAPVSEEYLLKRICFIYGREKVTSVVRQQFTMDMRGCDRNGIIRRNGFLYLSDQNKFMLRVPGVKRDVKYIAPEELAAGLHVLLKQNYTAEKDGLYRALVNQLGFTRIGDAIYAKLDEALGLLRDITIDGEIISLKQE
ncbi:DUF4011 domain-containing protein [Butyrivibrio sp. INlla14]|uniref:DUF4011 domain-containing protein n=1 Tax=Butyrivibrio sp. INlla14 TaxID=1520808 RepID=UPI000876CCEC|nr:DUF4011 domain-containing protein [Butyrivibrio sp. INlla14]SCY14145.1 Part of AAA domain-containing protein [Butyrivibrio sp. INlla14]